MVEYISAQACVLAVLTCRDRIGLLLARKICGPFYEINSTGTLQRIWASARLGVAAHEGQGDRKGRLHDGSPHLTSRPIMRMMRSTSSPRPMVRRSGSRRTVVLSDGR